MPAQGTADSGAPAAPQDPELTPQEQPGPPGGWRAAVAARIRPAWRLPLLTYLVCQAIYLFWWAAFYPGLMSFDSVTYLIHVTTGPWVDNHSVIYDSLVWLSLHATGGLGALTLAQTVAMAATLAYTVASLRRLGASGRWTAVAAVVVAALPSTGTFIVFVWKDVPFSICASLLAATSARLAAASRAPGWRQDPRTGRLIMVAGLELLGLGLFRLNGFIMVALAGIVLALLLRGLRRWIAVTTGVALGLTFLLNLVVYPAAGIQRTPAWLTYANSYADLAVAYRDQPTIFTAADKRLLAQVAPLTEWRSSGNCYDSDWTTNLPAFKTRAQPVSGQLVALWLRILRRSPSLILGARICRGSIAWSIFPGPARLDGRTLIAKLTLRAVNFPRLAGNPYAAAVRPRPLARPVHQLAALLWSVSRTPQLEWLLWRGATWCYLAYLALWRFARRRGNVRLLAIGAVVVAQQLGTILDNPSQLFRYMASPILIGIMLLPLLWTARPKIPAADERGGELAGGPTELS